MSISTEILNGDHDVILDNLMSTIMLRKKTLAQMVVADLVPGDTVMIKDCKPKLLVGKTATVLGITSNGVKVRMQFMANRRWSEAEVTCKPGMIEAI